MSKFLPEKKQMTAQTFKPQQVTQSQPTQAPQTSFLPPKNTVIMSSSNSDLGEAKAYVPLSMRGSVTK
jgi:hypothetical protein